MSKEVLKTLKTVKNGKTYRKTIFKDKTTLEELLVQAEVMRVNESRVLLNENDTPYLLATVKADIPGKGQKVLTSSIWHAQYFNEEIHDQFLPGSMIDIAIVASGEYAGKRSRVELGQGADVSDVLDDVTSDDVWADAEEITPNANKAKTMTMAEFEAMSA